MAQKLGCWAGACVGFGLRDVTLTLDFMGVEISANQSNTLDRRHLHFVLCSFGLGLFEPALCPCLAGERAASTGLVAVLLMHMSASMSNVNFAHNYYPTMLSLGVSLLLLTPQLLRPR